MRTALINHRVTLARGLAAGFGAAVLLLSGSAAVASPRCPSPAGTSDFRGVNWADPRDNYASDAVVPSGLATTDNYRTVYRTTQTMVKGFRQNLGANTLRLPINPASVGTAWWKSYRATIDAATAAGDKVILSYWEADTSKDGLIDDVPAWKKMWDTVVGEYRHNPRVYFEPMNEPHGYTLDQWVAVTSGWLARHSDVPRNRVVISGTGYNDNVTGVGAAQALRGTLLSLHFYGYWASYTTEAEWTTDLTAADRRLRRADDHRRGRLADDHRAELRRAQRQRLHLVPRRRHRHRPGHADGPGLLAGPAAGDAYSIESLTPTAAW